VFSIARYRRPCSSNTPCPEKYKKSKSSLCFSANKSAIAIWNRFVEVFLVTELFIEKVDFNEIAELSHSTIKERYYAEFGTVAVFKGKKIKICYR
jgi:hypothetical protein